MEIVRKYMRERKLSKDAIRCLEAQHRPSTKRMYHHHWEDWRGWCAKNGVLDPVRPTVHHLVNYMAHLSQERKLSAATLRSRRAAIASVLVNSGKKNVTEDVAISNIIRGAENLQPRRSRFLPQWDIAVILNYIKRNLRKNNELSFTLLTYKTAFLVALASGRRASEITNLSGLREEVSQEPNGTFCLKFLPEFLAKNQKPSEEAPIIRIKPLSQKVDPNHEDVSLCPVKALKAYRIRSNRFRSTSQRSLFISVNPAYSSDISRATFSRWLKTFIRMAYLALNREGQDSGECPDLQKARSHEIRAWAATMASTTTSLSGVMEAAYWKSPSVFIRHYLRDISRRSECGKLRLPAMVAAQAVIASKQ